MGPNGGMLGRLTSTRSGQGETPRSETIVIQSRNGQLVGCPFLFDLSGGQGRNRTADTLIFSLEILFR